MEHLIDTVRRYPCLWNTTAIEYRDQELKDAAWAEVMKETDLSSVKEVKLKWKKLRDSYRDALKRASETAARGGAGAEGAGSKRSYAWKYTARMQFLQPYMGNRKKAGESPPPAAPPQRSSSESEGESEPPPPPRRRRRDSPPPTPLLVAATAATGATAERDPLDIFFEGMCQSTKLLPVHAQIAIKKSLFSVVVCAEEALLAERQHQSYAALWPRSRRTHAPSTSGSDAPPS